MVDVPQCRGPCRLDCKECCYGAIHQPCVGVAGTSGVLSCGYCFHVAIAFVWLLLSCGCCFHVATGHRLLFALLEHHLDVFIAAGVPVVLPAGTAYECLCT
jgi:hypothetical protein